MARYGIDVLVIERNPQTVQEPRAVSIDDESLRTMQAAGIINALVPQIVLGYGSEYFSPGGRRFLKVKPKTLEYGYPRRNAFRQPVLERLLREQLDASEQRDRRVRGGACRILAVGGSRNGARSSRRRDV